MLAIATARRQKATETSPHESLSCGFAFALSRAVWLWFCLRMSKVRFGSQPEFQTPALRATCHFPELESQAGEPISIRVNFGYTNLIHTNKH
jgi:hypothetical protein